MRPLSARILTPPLLNLDHVPPARILAVDAFMLAIRVFMMAHAYRFRHVAVVPVPRPLVALGGFFASLFAVHEILMREVGVWEREGVPVGSVPVEVAGEGAEGVVG